MNRDELIEQLRLLCVSCQTPGSLGTYRHRACDQCSNKMGKIMALVDQYAESLPPPELMGPKDAAVFLGVTGSRVGQLISQGRLTVVQQLAMGPLLMASEVRQYAMGLLPGSPRKLRKKEEE